MFCGQIFTPALHEKVINSNEVHVDKYISSNTDTYWYSLSNYCCVWSDDKRRQTNKKALIGNILFVIIKWLTPAIRNKISMVLAFPIPYRVRLVLLAIHFSINESKIRKWTRLNHLLDTMEKKFPHRTKRRKCTGREWNYHVNELRQDVIKWSESCAFNGHANIRNHTTF